MYQDRPVLTTASEVGSLVRGARKTMRWSQADLAERLGVTRMTVSRLERGGDVAISTALAALALCGLQVVPTRRRAWTTLRELAGPIGSDLARGGEGFAVRRLRVALKDFERLSAPGDIEDFLAEPESTGDARWDTLIAVASARAAAERGLDEPQWTRRPRLRERWYPLNPSPLMVGLIRERTAPEFASRNIFIDEREWTLA